ncbi:MAG: hypothetical protein WKF65_08390 [Gaiellaceae bacterium]
MRKRDSGSSARAMRMQLAGEPVSWGRLGGEIDMRWRSPRILLTLVAGAIALSLATAFVGDFALAVFAALYVPVLVLALIQARPVLHWLLFAVIIASSVAMLLMIERNDSSSAGFGLIPLFFGLIAGTVVVATIDSFLRERRSRNQRNNDPGRNKTASW